MNQSRANVLLSSSSDTEIGGKNRPKTDAGNVCFGSGADTSTSTVFLVTKEARFLSFASLDFGLTWCDSVKI